MKNQRLNNMKELQRCKRFEGFFYSNKFYRYTMPCLINHKLKIVITNSADIKYVENIDYHFITYKNVDQLNDTKFIDEINKTIQRNNWIINKANELNNNLPNSERWFYEKFKDTIYSKEMNFTSNQIFKSLYICDMISLKYKTIIEVDGSYHDLPSQKLKDEEKDLAYIKATFNIIRVKHGDEDSYNECIKKLDKILKEGKAYNPTDKIKKYYSKKEKVYVRRKLRVDTEDFKERIKAIYDSNKLPF